MTVVSVAGTNTGDTKLSVTPEKESGNSYKYKVSNTAATVIYGQNVQTWTVWDGSSDITAESGKVITLVECDANYKAVKTGSVEVVSKTE